MRQTLERGESADLKNTEEVEGSEKVLKWGEPTREHSGDVIMAAVSPMMLVQTRPRLERARTEKPAPGPALDTPVNGQWRSSAVPADREELFVSAGRTGRASTLQHGNTKTFCLVGHFLHSTAAQTLNRAFSQGRGAVLLFKCARGDDSWSR